MYKWQASTSTLKPATQSCTLSFLPKIGHLQHTYTSTWLQTLPRISGSINSGIYFLNFSVLSILFQALIVQYTIKTLFQEVIPLGKHIWACPQDIIQGKSSVVSKFGGKIITAVIWNRYWMKQMLVAKSRKVWHFIEWNNL